MHSEQRAARRQKVETLRLEVQVDDVIAPTGSSQSTAQPMILIDQKWKEASNAQLQGSFPGRGS